MTESNELLPRLKAWIGGLLAYSMPIKIVLGTLITILGGSGLLGLLGEFATYSYAISYGFRPPVEGVPYLRATITLISVVVLLGSVLGFFILYALLHGYVAQFGIVEWVLFKFLGDRNRSSSAYAPIDRLRSQPLRKILPLIALIIILIVFAGLTLIYTLKPESTTRSYWIYPLSGLYLFLIYLCMLRPASIKYVAGGGVVIFMVLVPIFMFQAELYGTFLRDLGFGGGKIVSVFYQTEGDDKCTSTVDGGLMIRSADYMLIYVEEQEEVVEIPLANIEKIVYKKSRDTILPSLIDPSSQEPLPEPDQSQPPSPEQEPEQ